MKRCVLHIFFFLICTGISAQSKRAFSFESGAVINNPLIHQERYESQSAWTGSTDWTYTYYKSPGSYFKTSFDIQLKTKGKWSFSIPLSVTYMYQITKFHQKGFSYGCFGGESLDETRTVRNNNAISSIGFGVQHQDQKWRKAFNLNVNNCFTYNSKISSSVNNANLNYYNSNRQVSFNMYLSSQLFVLYSIRKNIWLGATCEIYYCNLIRSYSVVISEIKGYNSYDLGGPNIYITGKNIWIDPGIKLQIDLK